MTKVNDFTRSESSDRGRNPGSGGRTADEQNVMISCGPGSPYYVRANLSASLVPGEPTLLASTAGSGRPPRHVRAEGENQIADRGAA